MERKNRAGMGWVEKYGLVGESQSGVECMKWVRIELVDKSCDNLVNILSSYLQFFLKEKQWSSGMCWSWVSEKLSRDAITVESFYRTQPTQTWCVSAKNRARFSWETYFKLKPYANVSANVSSLMFPERNGRLKGVGVVSMRNSLETWSVLSS